MNAAGVRVEPRCDGPWVVTHGGRRFAVPPVLGRRLRAGDDPAGALALIATAPRRRARTRGPILRVPLLPAPLVRTAAARAAPLAGGAGLAAFAACGALLYAAAAAAPHAVPHAFAWPEAVAAVLLAGACHELGHAAALERGGGRPGAIGIGLLLVLPVLWCDVTEVALLPRRARLRVDVAGVCCHLPAGGALACAGAFCGRASLTWAGAATLAAIAWSVLPLLRTDGYWMLCDALGLRSLSGPPPPGASRALRFGLGAWRALRVAVFAAGASALGFRLIRALG